MCSCLCEFTHIRISSRNISDIRLLCAVYMLFIYNNKECQCSDTLKAAAHVSFFVDLFSGIGGGAHRERRPAAGSQHCVCWLHAVRQRHPGGYQHRRRPQLLHVGPCESLHCLQFPSEMWWWHVFFFQHIVLLLSAFNALRKYTLSCQDVEDCKLFIFSQWNPCRTLHILQLIPDSDLPTNRKMLERAALDIMGKT